MSSFHVGGKVVDRVDLLRKKQWPWRLDVWPFAILYGAWLSAILPSLDFVDAAIVFGALVSLHILVFLFTGWSVDFKCFAHYSKVKNIDQADSCKITPAKFSGAKEVVPLHSRKSSAGSSSAVDLEENYFDFRKQCLCIQRRRGLFASFPTPPKKHLDII